MAYKTEFVKKCANPVCSEKATHVVVTIRDEELGPYCNVHANVRVQRLHREEQREFGIEPVYPRTS